MDLTRGEGWEEQEIGRCAICGGWVVVYHHVAPASGPLREPWCIACGAVLPRDSSLPTTEHWKDDPQMTRRGVDGIEDPALRRAFLAGVRVGWHDGRTFKDLPLPESIENLPKEPA